MYVPFKFVYAIYVLLLLRVYSVYVCLRTPFLRYLCVYIYMPVCANAVDTCVCVCTLSVRVRLCMLHMCVYV